MEHFNELNPAEHERLALLAEELAESIQIIGKILRHGYENYHPVSGSTNRELLEKELGHLNNAISMMYEAKDLNIIKIVEHADDKRMTINEYLRHQQIKR